MRLFLLLITLLFPLISEGQKKYTLLFINNDYKVIKKHPETRFKDSITLKNYLKEFQSFAYKKGYLLASFDGIKKTNETHFSVHFSAGEKFQHAVLRTAPEEQRFLRKKGSISEKMLLKAPLTPQEFMSTLTTIQQNTTLAGEMLVVNLLRLINQEGLAQTEIEPKIIVRRSCGAVQPTL